ncbi:MAG: MFS transporter [Prosthecobacter sp.]|jgi:DHA2 family metal-tetracycline-proton antiporter-like MFS transporter|uniref:MFS transporter n=1 Tax=Prosthecobacter sp. TaxID=1965333 RepID=UPI0019F26CF5|nr:MFS transporter [Prosthecobacter sp.]MBE2282268.1 MFS transporter [Prosthecobacter sp.]
MSQSSSGKADMKLFWACFIALVATSFVFGVRANTIGELQDSFNLSESQKGAINGAGMWPFAISIIFFSLVIDWIGYKTVALFAIGCHIVSLVLTLNATGYESFYWSTLLVAVANGTVESFINPVVATVFNKDKSKWLNILHAGWPAGLALGALFCAMLPDTKLFFNAVWQFRFALCVVPVVIYALLILPCKFPVNERVAAGVSYRDMLKEVGAVGFFIIGFLMYFAIMQLAGKEASLTSSVGVGAIVGVAAGLYTGSLGNWLFIVVLVVIGPLATTELGTDGWMPELLKLNSPANSPNFAAWVFVYVSTIMTVLRFYAGPIVHRFSPIGLLVVGSGIAIVGLLLLSRSVGYAIVAAATVYAFGKTFLWSTTLGLTSEQFPKGGALTLNGVSAVGVLFLGVLGSPFIGYQQDKDIHARLEKDHGALLAQVSGPAKPSIFGDTPSLDQDKIKALPAAATQELTAVQADSKRGAFTNIAVLPAFMLLCYLGMWLYFRSKGGYKPVALGHGEDGEPGF